MTSNETWIIYKAADDAPGWEQRQLMPSGGLTDILSEELNYSGELPQVGDRVRAYENLEDPGNGVTHGKDGDWVVSRIQHFSNFDTSDRIMICHCDYVPIEAQWEAIKRGAPIEAVTA